MFNSNDHVITKVENPLKVTKSSMIEFSIGELRDTGLYRFRKIIEFNVGSRCHTRYLIYSKLESTEYIFEVFPGNNGQIETYLYSLADTVPFSEDFLEVAGQRYLTTPDGIEYERSIMPGADERIDGVSGRVKVYDIETESVESEVGVKLWDYSREADGSTELLNIEMMEDSGMFRIFIGEMIESIFYSFYQVSK